MAEIYPFRALHYNPAKVGDLGRVVTQPYDKISRELQARYYGQSPHNLVRIIRGRQEAEDSDRDNVYTRAARDLHNWIDNRVLVSDPAPALYPYYQEYEVPGRHAQRKQRRGFIALCRIEDYSAQIVHRHEETLSAPKADRLELLKATRSHFGQIFVLYSDPAGTIENLLSSAAEQELWEQVTDEYGTSHSVWRATEAELIEQVVTAMREKKLVIADGHHRYETALAYRDYCRSQQRPDDRAEYVMMTFIRMETDGLTILPTHRLVRNLPGFEWSQFAAKARSAFDWEEAPAEPLGSGWSDRFMDQLARAGREGPAFGVYAGPGRLALLRVRRDSDLATALPEIAPTLRQLDVVVLHRLILEQILGIDSQAVREERNVSYYREFEAAVQQVDEGSAQVCFALNPTPVEAVRDNALAGEPMPQKSTDFYPKLLSGLTIYWLDNPFGM